MWNEIVRKQNLKLLLNLNFAFRVAATKRDWTTPFSDIAGYKSQ